MTEFLKERLRYSLMNKKNTVISVIAVLVIIFALGAFETVRPSKTSDVYITFTDSNEAVVTLTEKPERAAVLFSSFADVWCESGGKVAITVGESIQREICSADVLLVDEGAGKTINTELLISYKPDFVITSADVPAQRETAELLRKAGIPVAELRMEHFDDYKKILSAMSKINGTTGETEKQLEFLSASIEKELEMAKGREEKKILFIRSGSSYSSAKAKRAEDHFAAKMLEELGCHNIADDAEILVDGLSVEEILRQDPDHIFISLMGDYFTSKTYMESVLESEAWQSLSAVKEGKVHFLPKELFQYKPCGKWDAAYQYLNGILGE